MRDIISTTKQPFYIIAGEASGDQLGAHIMKAFPHSYTGVGGYKMSDLPGFNKLFDSSELAVMGLVEILPHIPRLYRLIQKTVEDIVEKQPKALITIDAPDFNKRVVRLLRKHPAFQKHPFPCIHVGAPTVWAWRPGRAKVMAKLWDQLWTLFPFEPFYFPDLTTHFVGHPLGDPIEDMPPAREAHTCLLLPGSRVGEIRRHWPILKNVCERHPEMSYVLLTLPHLIPLFHEMGSIPPHCTVRTSYEMGRAHIALAASGTVSLELARAGTPMVTFYRMNPVTGWLAKKLIRTPYVNLINILLQKPIIPELLQAHATVDSLSEALTLLSKDPQSWQSQQSSLGEALQLLRSPYGSFEQSVTTYLGRL